MHDPVPLLNELTTRDLGSRCFNEMRAWVSFAPCLRPLLISSSILFHTTAKEVRLPVHHPMHS